MYLKNYWVKEYNESFFKKLDIIENNILDGQTFDETVQNDNLSVVFIKKINSNKEDENKIKITNIKDNLFRKIFNLNLVGSPEIINIDNKYYLV